MSRVYVGNLDSRVTERDLEDEFRAFGVLRSLMDHVDNLYKLCRRTYEKIVWVARRPPGYGFVEFDDRRDALDAIRDLDGKHGWRVELSHNSKGGGGSRGGYGRGGGDMNCYECGEPGHFARECRLRIGPGGMGSGRRRSPSPPRYRRSPSYGRGSRSPRGRRSPLRRSYSPRSRSPAHRRQDSPYSNRSPDRDRRHSYSPRPGKNYSRSPAYRRQDSPYANGDGRRSQSRSRSRSRS